MANLVRTTITLPEEVYEQAKILAAAEDMSMSKLISKLLEVLVKGERVEVEQATDSLGTLFLGTDIIYKKRDEIYGDRLRRFL